MLKVSASANYGAISVRRDGAAVDGGCLRKDEHYCKHCQGWFSVNLGERVSGDFLLVCPHCGWNHYRHFALGEAIHCDITKRHDDPKKIEGVRIGAAQFWRTP